MRPVLSSLKRKVTTTLEDHFFLVFVVIVLLAGVSVALTDSDVLWERITAWIILSPMIGYILLCLGFIIYVVVRHILHLTRILPWDWDKERVYCTGEDTMVWCRGCRRYVTLHAWEARGGYCPGCDTEIRLKSY